MKKTPSLNFWGIILILLFFSINTLMAQTIIPHNAKVSGIWLAKKSPYIIEGHAIIEQGRTLIIEPGTTIKFKTSNRALYNAHFYYKTSKIGLLYVKGTLIAKGLAKKKIIFEGQLKTPNQHWGSIYFCPTSTSKSALKYCKVSGGRGMWDIETTSGIWGAVSIRGASPSISYCTIHNNGWNGISLYDYAKSKIDHCLIEKNFNGGIDVYSGSKPLIDHCDILYNRYGIDCNGSLPKVRNTIIYGNGKVLFAETTASIDAKYCLLQVSSHWVKPTNTNIINKKPLFISASDYHIKPTSPCADTGEKGESEGEDIGIYPVEKPKKKKQTPEKISKKPIIAQSDKPVHDVTPHPVPHVPNEKEKKELVLKKQKFSHSISCNQPYWMSKMKFVANKSEYLNEREAIEELNVLVSYMKKHVHHNVILYGHTDFGQHPDILLELSRKRVMRVKEYLEKHGVTHKRITYRYYGGKYPLYRTANMSLRAENRRVEFKVTCD